MTLFLVKHFSAKQELSDCPATSVKASTSASKLRGMRELHVNCLRLLESCELSVKINRGMPIGEFHERRRWARLIGLLKDQLSQLQGLLIDFPNNLESVVLADISRRVSFLADLFEREIMGEVTLPPNRASSTGALHRDETVTQLIAQSRIEAEHRDKFLQLLDTRRICLDSADRLVSPPAARSSSHRRPRPLPTSSSSSSSSAAAAACSTSAASVSTEPATSTLSGAVSGAVSGVSGGAVSGSDAARAARDLKAEQELLTQDMAAMAGALKENVKHLRDALRQDLQVLSGTEKAAESNVERLKRDNQRLKDHTDTSWSTGWLQLGALLMAGCIFTMTFLFMRIVPKPAAVR